MTKNRRVSFVFAMLILLLATGLRYWGFASQGIGLNDQEITDIRLTETVRQGNVQVLYNLNGEGREGFYPGLLAATTGLTGSGLIGYTLPSIWLSMIMLALVYALTRRLYGDLAALAAMGLLAFSFFPLLLSRLIGRETLLPIFVLVVMLALALALPVYWRRRGTRSQTSAFGVLGLFVGAAFYIHPAGMVIALLALIIVVYALRSGFRISRQTRSYISFAALLAVIVATPYLTSAIRAPELGPVTRLFTGAISADASLLERTIRGLASVGVQGDLNPIYNIPGRPLFDPLSAIIILLGVVIGIRQIRKLRYALVIFALLLLLPLALYAPGSPAFIGFVAVLPVLAILFGLGITTVASLLGSQRLVAIGIAVLLAFNFMWTATSYFNVWPSIPDVRMAYHKDVQQLAHYVDVTSPTIPTVICGANIVRGDPQRDLPNDLLLLLMLNRKDAPLRYNDCSSGLLLLDGGDGQQLIMTQPDTLANANGFLEDWYREGALLNGVTLPTDRVLLLDVSRQLADTVGRFTTTATVIHAPETARNTDEVFFPPVRFGNNLTFLGYEVNGTNDGGINYQPGDTVPVITYWRVDGAVPEDLTLFTHIQDDPAAAPAANRDTISVVPNQLTNRDVFLETVFVPLTEPFPDGEYWVSIGAYQLLSGHRLPVFDATDDTLRGDRLFIYTINVTETED